jgi:hypothetical protein
MTAPEIAPEITALRLQAIRSVFIPIPLFGKEPPIFGKNNARKGLAGWSKLLRVTAAEIKLWERLWPGAVNTGFLSRNAPGTDIDIKIPDAADAVEMLVREHFEQRGRIYVRFGLPPKRLIPLRTERPFAKLSCLFKAQDGSEHKIEILADGQQYVVDGIHPDTGKPYAWFGGELAGMHRVNLPYVRQEDAQRFLDAAKRLLIEEFGFRLISESTGPGPRIFNGNGNGSGPHETNEKLEAPADRIAEALAVIPNNADWDGWNLVGMATWRATLGSQEGFAAFDAWSRKSPKYDADTTAAKWAEYFKYPPLRVGAGTIFHLANQASPNWCKPWRRGNGGART